MNTNDSDSELTTYQFLIFSLKNTWFAQIPLITHVLTWVSGV